MPATSNRYRIIVESDLQRMQAQVEQLLQEGWSFLGNLIISEHQDMPPVFVREMFFNRPAIPETSIDTDVIDQDFKVRYNKLLSQRTRDLLDINGIVLSCEGGRFQTTVNGETTEGFSPAHILRLLKNAKHYPLNADDEAILSELETLV